MSTVKFVLESSGETVIGPIGCTNNIAPDNKISIRGNLYKIESVMISYDDQTDYSKVLPNADSTSEVVLKQGVTVVGLSPVELPTKASVSKAKKKK